MRSHTKHDTTLLQDGVYDYYLDYSGVHRG